jgi:hypothetical protein
MIHIQQPGLAAANQFQESLLALDQWQAAQVLAADAQSIECVEETIRFPRHQIVELAAPILIEAQISPSRTVSSGSRPARWASRSSNLLNAFAFRETSVHAPPSTTAIARQPSIFNSKNLRN